MRRQAEGGTAACVPLAGAQQGDSLRHDVLRDDGKPAAHHDAHPKARDDSLRGCGVAQPQRGTTYYDAEVAQHRADEPHHHGTGSHEEAHGKQHGRCVDAEAHAGDGNGCEHGGDSAQCVTQERERACEAHGAEELHAGPATLLTRDQRLSCGLADGELQLRILHEVPSQKRRADEA